MQTAEKYGKTTRKTLTEFRTAPKKLPPPARKTDLQVWAAAAQISKLETKNKGKRDEDKGREREGEREGERERVRE